MQKQHVQHDIFLVGGYQDQRDILITENDEDKSYQDLYDTLIDKSALLRPGKCIKITSRLIKSNDPFVKTRKNKMKYEQ